MKILYKFSVNKEVEVDESTVSKDASGKDITITSKVKKQVPVNFLVARPNRRITEELELFYSSIYWQCVREHKIMPASQAQKRYLDDNGVLSIEQRKEYNALYEALFDKQAEQAEIRNRPEKTPENAKLEEDTFKEIVDIYSKIQDIENRAGNQLYQNTAENIARNRAALWVTLNLSYYDLGEGKTKPFFAGETYEDKLKSWDKIDEDENDFELEVAQRFLLVSSLFYFGKAQNQAEFDLAVGIADNQELIAAADQADTSK